MDVSHQKLKTLISRTDATFEKLKQEPSNQSYAVAYEEAKLALDHYLAAIRVSMQEKVKSR